MDEGENGKMGTKYHLIMGQFVQLLLLSFSSICHEPVYTLLGC